MIMWNLRIVFNINYLWIWTEYFYGGHYCIQKKKILLSRRMGLFYVFLSLEIMMHISWSTIIVIMLTKIWTPHLVIWFCLCTFTLCTYLRVSTLLVLINQTYLDIHDISCNLFLLFVSAYGPKQLSSPFCDFWS